MKLPKITRTHDAFDGRRFSRGYRKANLRAAIRDSADVIFWAAVALASLALHALLRAAAG